MMADCTNLRQEFPIAADQTLYDGEEDVLSFSGHNATTTMLHSFINFTDIVLSVKRSSLIVM